MMLSKHAFSLLAVAGLALASTAANAATTAYTNGDIFLGFRQAGNTSSLIVNLGQASQYRDGTVSGALSLGDLGAALNEWYGSDDWSSDASVTWGIVGAVSTTVGVDLANTLYASKPEVVFGTTETPYDRASIATQGNGRSNIVTMANAFAGKTSTTGSSVALIQSNTVAGAWGATSGASAANGFSYFSGMEGNFADGTATAALDLFRMQTGSGAGTLEGTFTINDAGVVSFNAAAAVPEPGRVAFLALGLGGFLLRRRRSVR